MQESNIVAKSTLASITDANQTGEQELGIDSWQMLQIFSIYRFLLASAFFILIALDAGTVGQQQPLLNKYILLIYFLLSIVYTVNSFFKNQAYYSQVMLQVITDIIALTIIIYASGGLASGLNILYLPVIAAASVLTPGKISFFYAAIATIAALSEQTYTYIIQTVKDKSNFTLAGLTGVAIFATAIAVNYIYRRLTLSQQLGNRYKATILKFENIVSTVLHKMPLGVLVVDEASNITIINNSAQNLLDIHAQNPTSFSVNTPIPAELNKLLQQWRKDSTNSTPASYKLIVNSHKFSVQFLPLSEDQQAGIIILLDDLRLQEQQAQNLKLISLGRLTASIAHEIRNPLNAISHSAQLLAESKNLNRDDTHLLQIIKNNSERTNRIIESVLLLSKARPIAQQLIHLKTWINTFLNQFAVHGHQHTNIKFVCESEHSNVFIDPTHLQQILTNLSENAIRYSMQQAHEPYALITLKADGTQVYLNITDKGPGITAENIKYLFEPFFTTENTGTGLGLFVAHELCQANGAKLEYISLDGQGGCFRIYFPNNKQ